MSDQNTKQGVVGHDDNKDNKASDDEVNKLIAEYEARQKKIEEEKKKAEREQQLQIDRDFEDLFNSRSPYFKRFTEGRTQAAPTHKKFDLFSFLRRPNAQKEKSEALDHQQA